MNSCCLLGSNVPQGKVTYVDREVRPSIWKLLSDMDVDGENPVLAKGENFDIKKSDLVKWMLRTQGQEQLHELARVKSLYYHFKKSKITVSMDEVNNSARELLLSKNMKIEEYLKQRLINREDLVNEIELNIFSVKLAKQEIVKMGAVKIRIKNFSTQQEAESKGLTQAGQANWYAPFMILKLPKLRDALFKTNIPKVVKEGESLFFAVDVVDRMEPISEKNPNFAINLKKLDDFHPDKETIRLFLDYLVKKQGLEFLPEKIYDKYDSSKRNQ